MNPLDKEGSEKLDDFFKENPDWRKFADLVAAPPTADELLEWYPEISPEALARCEEWVNDCGCAITRGALYVRVRREDGRYGDKWATMLCLQAPPGVQTNDTFWGGRKHFSEVYGTEYADMIRAKLARRGVALGYGDEYMPELARFQGDPEAIVKFGSGRGYIKKLCEKRGWGINGAVNVNCREPERDELAQENCIPMGEDIIRQKARMLIKQNPELKKLPKKALRERVLAKFGPSKT